MSILLIAKKQRNKKPANIYPCSFLLLCLVPLSCLKVHIAPLHNTKGELYGEPQGERQSLASRALFLRVEGKRAYARNWIKALSISRFFYSGLENQSGSVAALLQKPIARIAQSKAYCFAGLRRQEGGSAPAKAALLQGQTFCAAQEGSYELHIFLEKQHLLWLPPKIFIQTPKSRREGEVRLDFLIRSKLLGKKKTAATTGGKGLAVLWEDLFMQKTKLGAYPEDVKESLEILGHQVLAAYLKKLAQELPAAGELRE